MILVDTSIWIDHLRRRDEILTSLLEREIVLGHPLVTGELAMGSMPRRDFVLNLLRRLPTAAFVRDDEVMTFIDRESLFGIGIGFIDAHLLAATRLTSGATLWTRDRRLMAAAEKLALAARVFH